MCQNLYRNSFTYHGLSDEKVLQFDDAIKFLGLIHIPTSKALIFLKIIYLFIWGFDPPSIVFCLIFYCVDQCEKDKARVLVHCMSGKSR